jgi:hypothetical protein
MAKKKSGKQVCAEWKAVHPKPPAPPRVKPQPDPNAPPLPPDVEERLRKLWSDRPME